MKNTKIIISFFFINLICNLSGKSQDQKYLQIGFTNNESIPVSYESGKFYDKNGLKWTTYSLKCADKKLESVFNNFKIVDFRQEFPLALKFENPNASILNRVYRIVIVNGSEDELKQQLLKIESTSIHNVFITYTPKSLVGANPNDYNATYNGYNDVYGYGAARQYLDLINAKQGWEFTRGLESVSIGIVDINFLSHNDLDSKVKNINSLATALTPNTYPHGIFVAGISSAIPDNNFGVAGVGYNTSVKYYDMYHNYGTIPNYQNLLNGYIKSPYTGMMQAALDGCKVINCSWRSYHTDFPTPPINNDYNQLVINMITSMGITVVAAAGNHTTTNGNGYVYPASYENVISATGVGCSYPLSSQINTKLLGTNVFTQNHVKDCHELVIGFPNGIGGVNCSNLYQTYEHNSMVDICAPAYAIHTLTSNNSSGFSNDGGSSGTSFASPMIAGAAALLYSLNPNFTPADIEYYLKAGADDIYNLNHNGVYPNLQYANLLGSGRLNIGNSLKLVNDNDAACMPRINDIEWSGGIFNNDYIFQNIIDFNINNSFIPNDSEIEWEFVSGNDIVKKTGLKVSINWGVDFSYFIGPYERVNVFPLEVYVRQRNKNNNECVSAFYKEVGFSPLVSGGSYSEKMPYPSEVCDGNNDGNVVIDRDDVIAKSIKGRNVYIGKSLFDINYSLPITVNQNLVDVAASNEIRLLPGVDIKRPTFNSQSWQNYCEPSPTLFKYFTHFRAFISNECQVPNQYKTPSKNITKNNLVKYEKSNEIKVIHQNKIAKKASNFRIFPNPSSDLVTLEMFNINSSFLEIQIIDILGKVKFQSKKQINKGIQQFPIQISEYSKGIYIIKIKEQTTESILKFVKN